MPPALKLSCSPYPFHFNTEVRCLLHGTVLFSPSLNKELLINRSGNVGCGLTLREEQCGLSSV